MSEKEKMMRRIQMYCFAAYEAALFLDTHPQDKTAIEYYNKQKAMLSKAKAEYEEKYGPVSMPLEEKSGEWKWATQEWPWEVSK